jgi:hypothetical protein
MSLRAFVLANLAATFRADMALLRQLAINISFNSPIRL